MINNFKIEYLYKNTSAIIYFDIYEKIFFKEIFAVLKYLIFENITKIKLISIIGYKSDNENNNIYYYHNIKLRTLNKYKYIDFRIFLEELIEEDWKYLIEDNCKFLGFKINFYLSVKPIYYIDVPNNFKYSIY